MKKRVQVCRACGNSGERCLLCDMEFSEWKPRKFQVNPVDLLVFLVTIFALVVLIQCWIYL